MSFNDDQIAATVEAHPTPWELVTTALAALSLLQSLYGPASERLRRARRLHRALILHLGRVCRRDDVAGAVEFGPWDLKTKHL